MTQCAAPGPRPITTSSTLTLLGALQISQREGDPFDSPSVNNIFGAGGAAPAVVQYDGMVPFTDEDRPEDFSEADWLRLLDFRCSTGCSTGCKFAPLVADLFLYHTEPAACEYISWWQCRCLHIPLLL